MHPGLSWSGATQGTAGAPILSRGPAWFVCQAGKRAGVQAATSARRRTVISVIPACPHAGVMLRWSPRRWHATRRWQRPPAALSAPRSMERGHDGCDSSGKGDQTCPFAEEQ
jgi:hypothetical protein